jgi:hypothetical protein
MKFGAIPESSYRAGRSDAASRVAPRAIVSVEAVPGLRRPLTRTEHKTLVEIIARDAPDLLPLARDAVNVRWLDDDECERLTNALLDVFRSHLRPNDEPDMYGATADDLIGLVEMQRRGYWDE